MSAAFPSDYIPPFTPDEVKQRFVYLCECCHEYLEFMRSRHPTWELQFDPLVMMNVSFSTMDDIWRWKVYHLRQSESNRLSDSVKRATYFTKWLVKLRPIYFINRPITSREFITNFDNEEATLLVNEHFAIHNALTFIATDANRDVIILDDETMGRFLYHLRYRDVGADSLNVWFHFVVAIAKNCQIIMP
jgi:hypothetical protein